MAEWFHSDSVVGATLDDSLSPLLPPPTVRLTPSSPLPSSVLPPGPLTPSQQFESHWDMHATALKPIIDNRHGAKEKGTTSHMGRSAERAAEVTCTDEQADPTRPSCYSRTQRAKWRLNQRHLKTTPGDDTTLIQQHHNNGYGCEGAHTQHSISPTTAAAESVAEMEATVHRTNLPCLDSMTKKQKLMWKRRHRHQEGHLGPTTATNGPSVEDVSPL